MKRTSLLLFLLFAAESRLANEATSFEEIHFTPGTPFFARARIGFRF